MTSKGHHKVYISGS